jgi:hypothetical protein
VRDDVVEDRGQLLQLVDVRGNQLIEPVLSFGGEPDPDDPAVWTAMPGAARPARSGPRCAPRP